MINRKLPHALLLSIFICSFAPNVYSQQNTPLPGAGGPGGTAIGEDVFAAPPGQSLLKRGEQRAEFNLDGVSLTASRVRSFTVTVGTLQIQPVTTSGGIGYGAEGGVGMEYGNWGGVAGGADPLPGSSGGGGKAGGMPGMSGGGMGGMGMGSAMGGPGMGEMGGMGMGMGGMGMGGMGMGGMPDMRVVTAFMMDDEKVAGRTRIEVLAAQGPKGNYVRLEALSGAPNSKAKADKKAPPLWSPAAAKLIKDTISLKIWKEDAINSLKSEEGKGDQAAASEKLLRALLSEEYDTQLERQHFELMRLEERLKRIQDEFSRRKQAKDRVIDVQLGKIILEAQGILGEQ